MVVNSSIPCVINMFQAVNSCTQYCSNIKFRNTYNRSITVVIMHHCVSLFRMRLLEIICYVIEPLLLTGHVTSSCLYFHTYNVYFYIVAGLIYYPGISLLESLLTVKWVSEHFCSAYYFLQYIMAYLCLIRVLHSLTNCFVH